MRKHLNKIEDEDTRDMLEALPEGILRTLRDKIDESERTVMPIAYITRAIARKLSN